MAPKRNRKLAIAAIGPKQKLPASRRRAKQEKKNQIQQQAVVLHNRATRSRQAFTPVINASSDSIANLNTIEHNNEHINSEDELSIMRFDVPLRATTSTPRTPQRQTTAQSKQKQRQKTPIALGGLLTPPNSGSSSRNQKTVKKTSWKKKVSDFRTNLATAYHEDEVFFTGTQVNIKSSKRSHSWTVDERKVLCVLKRL